MKRTLITILACFYLGVSSGATVHFHYCMGQLVKWGFAQPEKSLCDFCKTPVKSCGKSCCKDDQKQAKVDQSQKVSTAVYQFKQLGTIKLTTNPWNFTYVAVPIKTHKAALCNAPPLIEDIPVFIRNCTYRI